MTDQHEEYKEVNSPFFSERARADFEGALRKGFWRAIWSWVTQSDNRLLPFDEIRSQLPLRGQHDIGMMGRSISAAGSRRNPTANTKATSL